MSSHIICPDEGAYWVETPEGTWLVPEGLAIWIPPLVPHEVYSHGSVSARIIFVDETQCARLPEKCGTVLATDFLRALAERTVEYGNDYTFDSKEARLVRVLLDELGAMNFAPIPLPISSESRLARVMRRLIEQPEEAGSFDEIARQAAASPRTLARPFRRETGMTFKQWKTNLVVSEAIRRLAGGFTVTEVALDLGHASPSSFTYMFRSKLGVSPRQYRVVRKKW